MRFLEMSILGIQTGKPPNYKMQKHAIGYHLSYSALVKANLGLILGNCDLCQILWIDAAEIQKSVLEM